MMPLWIRKRRSFTDKLYFLNFFMVQFITQECFLLITLSAAFNFSSTGLAAIKVFLTCAWTELSAHTALIIWKAKKENELKFGKSTEEPETTTDLQSKIDSISLDIIEDEAVDTLFGEEDTVG